MPDAAPGRTGAIVAEISAAAISGQVAVGSHNLQVVADHGAIVNVAESARRPTVRARSTPVAIRPRDFPSLLGREHEIELTLAAIANDRSVSLYGPSGMGKTSLLRRISHVASETLEHGVVFVRAADQPLSDLAAFLFDAFYEADMPYVPTPAELRRHLADRRALVVVDDLDRDHDDLAELLDCAPGCVFLLASQQQCLLGEGRAVALDGLAADAAIALLARELGRVLRPEERDQATDLCHRLGGRPLSLLQAAALARNEGLQLDDVRAPEAQLHERLSNAEQDVLSVLKLLAPAAAHVDDIAAIAELPDAVATLERLRDAGAAQEAHRSRWSIRLAYEPREGRGSGQDPLPARACSRLADGAARRPLEDVPVLLAALRHCVEARRPADVLALARAADPLLTLSGRWGAWEIVLKHAQAAAEELGDRTGAAWALHQRGTRRCCIGDVKAAGALLEQAVALRRELGDETGAAVSEHNLTVLRGGAPTRSPSPARVLAIGAAVLAIGAGAALLLTRHHDAPVTPSNVAVTGARSTPSPPTSTTPPQTQTTTTQPPSTVTLGVDGDLSFVSTDGASVTHRVFVVDRGPVEIALAPNIDNSSFAVDASHCPSVLAVDQGCTLEITYNAEQAPTSAVLNFKGSSTWAELLGSVSAPSGTTATPAPTPTTTGTTTTPAPG